MPTAVDTLLSSAAHDTFRTTHPSAYAYILYGLKRPLSGKIEGFVGTLSSFIFATCVWYHMVFRSRVLRALYDKWNSAIYSGTASLCCDDVIATAPCHGLVLGWLEARPREERERQPVRRINTTVVGCFSLATGEIPHASLLTYQAYCSF